MQLPEDTTIVVTDGQKLRLFRNIGTALHVTLTELPKADVHGAEGADRHQHTGQDKKDHEETGYGMAVAKWINHEVTTGRIGALYIIAPPRALGELRQHYGNMLKTKLVGELAKEHANDSVHDLELMLRDS